MKIDIRKIFLLTGFGILLGMATFLLGCGGEKNSGSTATPAEGPPTTYPYVAVATVGMVGDLVKNIAGTNATVQVLIRPGVDPHLYQPLPSDQKACEKASIIFYAGHHLEGKMIRLFDAMRKKGKSIHAVSETLPTASLLTDDENKEAIDPHAWMDVSLWSEAAKSVATALSSFDPANASVYAANLEAYQKQLAPLHAYAKARAATIPDSQRILVTAHDAFRYWGAAYHVEVMGVQGLSPQAEAGIKRINDLVALLVERKVPAIFTETSVSDENVQALIVGARKKGHEVKLGGKLFSDAMGPSNQYEGTYIGMIDHNTTTLVRALGGEAPVGGLNGKLQAAKAKAGATP